MISEEKQKALEAALGNIEKQTVRARYETSGDSSSHMQVESSSYRRCLSLAYRLGGGVLHIDLADRTAA